MLRIPTVVFGVPGRMIQRVALSPDGRLGAAGSDDGAVQLWDMDARSCLLTLRPTQPQRGRPQHGTIAALFFTPDGQLLVTAYESGALCVWRVPSGEAAHAFDGIYQCRAAVAHPGGKYVLSFHPDSYSRRYYCWNLANGKRAREYGTSVRVEWLWFRADGHAVVYGEDLSRMNGDEVVHLWDLRKITASAPVVSRFVAHRESEPGVMGVELSADGSTLAVDTQEFVRAYRVDSGQCVHTWHFRQRDGGLLMALARDGSAIVTSRPRLAVFEVGRDKPVRELAKSHAGRRVLAFDPEGRFLVADESERGVAVWRTSDWSRVGAASLGFEPTACAIRADGRVLAGGASGGVAVVDPA